MMLRKYKKFRLKRKKNFKRDIDKKKEEAACFVPNTS